MPTWLKVLLALALFGALGFATCVGGVAYWTKQNGGKLIEATKTATVEGEAFGKVHSKDECVDDALTRLNACTPLDVVCETMERVRLSACMRVAVGGHICDEAPGRTEVLRTATWSNAECTRRGNNLDGCARIMQSVVVACDAAKRRQ